VKVIFIEDVPNVARVGQTRVVADGYARNFLLPHKLAVQADSHAAAAIDAQLKKKVKQRELEEAEMAELAKKISGVEIVLRAKVGENDKLYGSITGADIAEALTKAAGCTIDKHRIDLAEPIKQAGDCDVTVRFTREISAVIKVRVISEDAVEVPPAAEGKKAKAEKSEDKPAKAEKAPKAEKTPKAEKAPKAEKTPKAEKAPKTEKSPKAEKAAETETPAETEKTAKTEKAEKTPKAPKKAKAKAETGAEEAEAVPEEPEKAEKAEKKPRAKKAKKAEEPESREK
jgi:large subunit ribosomal protein L9